MSGSGAHAWETTALALAGATQAAALAAWPFRGLNQPDAADAAAADALRVTLAQLGAAVHVITGEGEKDGVQHVAAGERLGTSRALAADLELAVDPIDGTTRLSLGRPGALAAASLVPRGGMFDPGPSHYMNKIVCSAAAAQHIDPEQNTAELIAAVARGLGKSASDVRVFVLDKPRHVALVSDLRAIGARVLLHDAGDLEASIMAAMPSSDVDLVLGIGGTPEGLVAACAVRALDGCFFGRLSPQRPDEQARMHAAGLLPARWLMIDELVPATHVACSVTGITTCALVAGIQEQTHEHVTETIVFWGPGAASVRMHRIHPRRI